MNKIIKNKTSFSQLKTNAAAFCRMNYFNSIWEYSENLWKCSIISHYSYFHCNLFSAFICKQQLIFRRWRGLLLFLLFQHICAKKNSLPRDTLILSSLSLFSFFRSFSLNSFLSSRSIVE